MKKIHVLGIFIATLFSTTSCGFPAITVSGYEVKLNKDKQGYDNTNFHMNNVSIASPDYKINGSNINSVNEDFATYKSNLLPLNVIPLEYTPELAKNSRNIVISPGELIFNLEEINNFMTHTQMGIKDYIRIAFFDESGIPIIMDLEYDGFIITLTIDKSRLATETDGIEKIIYDKLTLEVEYNPEKENNIISYILSSNDIDNSRVLFQIPEAKL